MKFEVYELQLASKTYRIFDALNVPSQLRVACPQGDTPAILANATGFDFLEEIFKIASMSMKDNCIIRVKDHSAKKERFHDWYPSCTEHHKDLIISNYQYTQIGSKDVVRLMKMLKYQKPYQLEIRVPEVSYDYSLWWKLKGALNVDKRGNCLTVSSNNLGFLYMAKEASLYHDMEDDEDECFEHSHLMALCNKDDLLDMRYYFEANYG